MSMGAGEHAVDYHAAFSSLTVGKCQDIRPSGVQYDVCLCSLQNTQSKKVGHLLSFALEHSDDLLTFIKQTSQPFIY